MRSHGGGLVRDYATHDTADDAQKYFAGYSGRGVCPSDLVDQSPNQHSSDSAHTHANGDVLLKIGRTEKLADCFLVV
jgi:hypothetical protein